MSQAGSLRPELVFGAFPWLKNYLVTFIFLYLVPSIKEKLGLIQCYSHMEPDLKRYGKASMWAMGFDVEIINPHNIDLTKDYILAANHRSWFDQIALLASFPKGIHFLAKEEYFQIPIYGRCLKNFKMIPVSNKRLRNGANEVLESCLVKNENVCFFVEGTRGAGRELLPFKKGAFRYAAKFQKDVLPIYILGAEKCSSKARHLFDVKPGTISIVIGRPQKFDDNNFAAQFENFEQRFRRVHNQLYTEFEIFSSQAPAYTRFQSNSVVQA